MASLDTFPFQQIPWQQIDGSQRREIREEKWTVSHGVIGNCLHEILERKDTTKINGTTVYDCTDQHHLNTVYNKHEPE